MEFRVFRSVWVVYFANGESHISLVNGPGPFAKSWQYKPCSLKEHFMLGKRYPTIPCPVRFSFDDRERRFLGRFVKASLSKLF